MGVYIGADGVGSVLGPAWQWLGARVARLMMSCRGDPQLVHPEPLVLRVTVVYLCTSQLVILEYIHQCFLSALTNNHLVCVITSR